MNIQLSASSFEAHKTRAIEALSQCKRLYVVDGFAGWDPDYRIKVRILCSRPYHALFMHNMLMRPSARQLEEFGEPEMVIYNAGCFAADNSIDGIETDTCVALNLSTPIWLSWAPSMPAR